ncbi:MAG TPA: hypothetical protein VF765_19090 [Polyangiaceae bacterium]
MPRERRRLRAWLVVASALVPGAAACGGILAVDGRQPLDAGTGDDGSSSDDGGPASQGDGAGGSSSDSASRSDAGAMPPVSCGGAPCVLATGLDFPFEVASDDKNVYWTEYGEEQSGVNGAVKGCPISGCGSGPTIYASALTFPRGITVDGTHIYFGTASFEDIPGAIWSCPVTGCNGSPTKLSDAEVPYGIAVDSTRVYWADYYDDTVHSVPKAGGSASALLFDGGGLATEGELITADSAFLYFTDGSGDVYKLPIGGGDAIQMASWNYGGGWPVVVDSTTVYYGQLGGVSAMSKDATKGGAFIVSNLRDPLGLVLDPTTRLLYWADYGTGTGIDGTIGRVATDGSGRTLIASSQINVEDITVAGNYVFWISSGIVTDLHGTPQPGSGELLRMPK